MTNRDEFRWTDKFRPHTIADCILPDRLKQTFQAYADQKEIPHLLLCGPAGTGKTTVALALCDEVGCDSMFINGSEESGIDVLRTKIKSYASTVSLQGGKKVIIIDEADYMNPNSLQPGLRSAIEEFSKNCSFVMTCNFKNKLIEPLHSRCPPIDFTLTKSEKPQMATLFYQKVTEILDKENVLWVKEPLVALIMKYFPDFRRIINELQKYSVTGPIDNRILGQIVDVDITDLVKFLKDKDFQKVRKWVNTNTDTDANRIFRRIYDGISNILKASSIPEIIIVLAKYQFQSAFSVDQELNLLACLTEVMVTGEFL